MIVGGHSLGSFFITLSICFISIVRWNLPATRSTPSPSRSSPAAESEPIANCTDSASVVELVSDGDVASIVG